jgi:hypothetical protein
MLPEKRFPGIPSRGACESVSNAEVVAEHNDWCSILRTQREMDARAQAAAERA